MRTLPITALESIPGCAEKMRQNLSPYDLSPSNVPRCTYCLSELINFNRLRLQKKIQLTTYAQPTPAPQNGAFSPTRTPRSMFC